MQSQQEKERTLLAAWVIALWSPLTYSYAALLGRSTLMLADLFRRTIELVILFLSWLLYRQGRLGMPAESFIKWEKRSSIMVGVVMLVSVFVILIQALSKLQSPSPLGRVTLGIIIGGLGLLVNGWFWRKHAKLAKQEVSSMFESQWRLFRAKTLLDGWVVISLASSHYLRGYPWGRYLDPLGSLIIAAVLFVSALQIFTVGKKLL